MEFIDQLQFLQDYLNENDEIDNNYEKYDFNKISEEKSKLENDYQNQMSDFIDSHIREINLSCIYKNVDDLFQLFNEKENILNLLSEEISDHSQKILNNELHFNSVILVEYVLPFLDQNFNRSLKNSDITIENLEKYQIIFDFFKKYEAFLKDVQQFNKNFQVIFQRLESCIEESIESRSNDLAKKYFTYLKNFNQH